jgi:hypothetical protein
VEKKSILDEKTLIPIGAVSLIFGAAVWLSSVWYQGDVNAAQIQEIKATQERDLDKVYNKLEKIDSKIDHIMEKLRK